MLHGLSIGADIHSRRAPYSLALFRCAAGVAMVLVGFGPHPRAAQAPSLAQHAPDSPLPAPESQLEPGVGWDGFPVFLWRQSHRGRALAPALLNPFGGTNIEGDEEAPWALAAELDFYVGHAPGRNILHLRRDSGGYDKRFEAWLRSRDASLLARVPCLSEAQTRAQLIEHLNRSLRAREGQTGLGISLGDEVSLTPWGDPFDLCRSTACQARWKTWCAERGRDSNDLSTDTLRLAFAEGDSSGLSNWLARREFHQSQMVELLGELARHARAELPAQAPPIGLLGLAGQSTFGGIAVERILPTLDFIECYPTGNARELLFSLRDRQRSLATIFSESGGPSAAAWQAWEHWLRGGDGLVLWSDLELERDPALADRLAETVRSIRALQAKLGPFKPRPSGVALLHHPQSAALAWLRDALLDGPTWPNRLAGYQRQFGTLERHMDAWLRAVEDVGCLPGALPPEAWDAEGSRRFPLWIASHLALVSDRELAKLREHLRKGGSLLVDGPFAQFDGSGLPRTTPAGATPFELLQNEFPGRVLAPQFDLLRAHENRLNVEHPLTRHSREKLEGTLRNAGVQLPPFKPPGGPWLLAGVKRENSTLWAMLPNLTTEAQRSNPIAIPDLDWKPAADSDFERHLPSPSAKSARPGTPLVFELRNER